MPSIPRIRGSKANGKALGKGFFDYNDFFYGTVKPDYSIFTRNQCHVEECWRNIYKNNLCKRHSDLEHYRGESAFLDTVRLPDGRLPIKSLRSL